MRKLLTVIALSISFLAVGSASAEKVSPPTCGDSCPWMEKVSPPTCGDNCPWMEKVSPPTCGDNCPWM